MTIDYKAVANNPGANVIDQAAFLVALGVGGAIQNGFQAGTAQSAQMNKVWRQSSVMTAALATMISEALGGIDVLDDGNVDALKVLLKAALLTSAWSTGDAKLTFKNVADAGWVMANDGSIGSAASGATTRANADTLPLYSLLWANVADAQAPVAGGRGANAAADFAANKPMSLTKALGRMIGIAGAGAGLTPRVLGQTLGAESHNITSAELPADAWIGIGGGPATFDTTPQNAHSWGGGAAMSLMNPVTYMNAMLKL